MLTFFDLKNPEHMAIVKCKHNIFSKECDNSRTGKSSLRLNATLRPDLVKLSELRSENLPIGEEQQRDLALIVSPSEQCMATLSRGFYVFYTRQYSIICFGPVDREKNVLSANY